MGLDDWNVILIALWSLGNHSAFMLASSSLFLKGFWSSMTVYILVIWSLDFRD